MIHVISGSPCSGKTTFVERNANPGDLVIDADKIAKAFGGAEHQSKGEPLKVALKARDVAIEHALNGKSEAWIIDTMPTDERMSRYKEAGAEIVVLDVGKSTCLERAKTRPSGTVEAIEKWYASRNINSMRGGTMETVKQEMQAEPEKTFTQAEVDAIVGDRLKRDRAKYVDYEELKQKAARLDEIEEASKTELQKAKEKAAALQTTLEQMKKADAVRVMREKVASETGVPIGLITAETEEEARTQAASIMEFARPSGYPSVRDGGEARVVNKNTTREQFAQWFNSL